MLTITLLGTAATMPLPDRALTAAAAECVGHSLLFDCGEGTQAAACRGCCRRWAARAAPARWRSTGLPGWMPSGLPCAP